MFPTAALSLALALVLAFAVGCGGGDDGTTAAETTAAPEQSLTKAELLSQGDAICAEINAAVGAIGATEGDVAEQTTNVAELYVGMIGSIQELGQPDESEGYAEFSEAAEQLAKIEGEIKLAAERGDTEALGAAATAAAPALEEFQAQAAIYGFEECSEGPSAPVAAPETGGETGGVEGGGVEEGGGEVAPEIEEEVVPEEVAPEEVAPETGGAGGGVEEAPEEAPETGGGSGGVGPD